MDTFVEQILIPEYTRGRLRTRNPAYSKVEYAIAKARHIGDRTQVRELIRRQHSMPSRNPCDPGYRRLRYTRYADDTLLGFAGPKIEAEAIKQRLATFLREELKLNLAQEKTLITHARTGRARFLGYEISIGHSDRRTRRSSVASRRNRRTVNGAVRLHVPPTVIKAKSALYLARGIPACRNPIVNEDDYTIVAKFGAEYRGVVQYYLLAGDVYRLHRLHWVMESSLLRTLARKHHSTVLKTSARFKTKVDTPYGLRTCFEASINREGRNPLVARFGGIPLKRQKMAVITDRQPVRPLYPHKELTARLLRGRCEICTRTDGTTVHHVAKLADLAPAGPDRPIWAQVMAKRRRKTLVVCGPCHDHIHSATHSPALTQ